MPTGAETPLEESRIQIQRTPKRLHHSGRKIPTLFGHVQSDFDSFAARPVQKVLEHRPVVNLRPSLALEVVCNIQYGDDQLFVFNIHPHVIIQQSQVVPAGFDKVVDVCMVWAAVFRRLLPSFVALEGGLGRFA